MHDYEQTLFLLEVGSSIFKGNFLWIYNSTWVFWGKVLGLKFTLKTSPVLHEFTFI